jgi:hypothetical protein
LRPDGSHFPPEIAPRRAQQHMTGDAVVAAMRAELNANQARGQARAHTIRLVCSKECGQGAMCHGDTLAAVARSLVTNRDAKAAAQQPVKARRVRKDKGVKRGPRRVKGGAAYRIGMLSLYRYRYGMERQVSERTLAAVREGRRAGVQPWLVDGVHETGDMATSGASCSAAVSDSCCGACPVEEAEFTDRGELMELTAALHTDGEAQPLLAEGGSSSRAGGQESAEQTPQRQRWARSGSAHHARLRLARSKQRSITQQLLELGLVEGRRDHEDLRTIESVPGDGVTVAVAGTPEQGTIEPEPDEDSMHIDTADEPALATRPEPAGDATSGSTGLRGARIRSKQGQKGGSMRQRKGKAAKRARHDDEAMTED